MQSAPRSPARRPGSMRSPSSSMTTSSPRPTSRSTRAQEVERARLRGHDPVVAQPADRERAEAVGVAEGDQLAFRDRGDRVRALEPAIAAATASSSGRSSFATSAAISSESDVEASSSPRAASSSRSSRRIDEVAVVPERDGAGATVVDERLRVLPRVGARRRVAVVADRDLALEAVQLLLVEHLRDEAELAQHGQPTVSLTRRFRPTPGRGAGARMQREVVRRATSRSGARMPNTPHIRRVPSSPRHPSRVSSSVPGATATSDASIVPRNDSSTSAGGARSTRRPRTGRVSSPPSERSWTSEKRCALCQTNARGSASGALGHAAARHASPRAPAAWHLAHVRRRARRSRRPASAGSARPSVSL